MNAVLSTYRMMLRQQLTTGRLALVAGFSALGLAVAFAIGRVDAATRIEDSVGFLSGYGLALMVPIVSLVLGSSTFGELVDDETLVYLWHRPVARWKLALAGTLSASSVAIPLTAVPLTLAAVIASGDATTTWATALAASCAAFAYSALFVFVGLLLRRALIWGLVYLFIWELFIASVGGGSAQLSIRTYPTSILARLTEVDIRLADSSVTTGIVVSLIIGLAAVGLTSYRLDRMDVA
jgi:ABC-2 type transport system permease protein